MEVVQRRLDHSSMALTADTYTHVLPDVTGLDETSTKRIVAGQTRYAM
jgi:integrase